MKILKTTGLIVAAASLSACVAGNNPDKSVDRQFGGGQSLTELQAGIWISPDGCDHWIIDDGLEGYLSPRVDKYGKPVCSGIGQPGTAVGPFKGGAEFGDIL